MVDWPETRSGSGPVVMACPGSEGRTVTRECINGIWTEADYNVCLSFTDIETMVSFHDNVNKFIKLIVDPVVFTHKVS